MLKLVVSGKEVSVIEDERKDKAISTFLYFVDSPEKKIVHIYACIDQLNKK